MGLAGLPFVRESPCNGVDYTSDLLGGLVFPFLRRLSLTSLMVVSLSSLIFCFVSSFSAIAVFMVILLVSFGSHSYCMTVRPLDELG